MRRPSPSMIVSIIAVVMASAGTSVAAINFAKNAGAVDGKSAVSGSATNARAAGKLVAAGKSGRIPIKFLDLKGIMRGEKQTFAQGIQVVDNASATPIALAGVAGLGLASVTCTDQAAAAGTEDPAATITFANTSGQTINFARSIGNGQAVVTTVAPSAQTEFTINNANTFELFAQTGDLDFVMNGAVRQDGRGTATGGCAIWGYALSL